VTGILHTARISTDEVIVCVHLYPRWSVHFSKKLNVTISCQLYCSTEQQRRELSAWPSDQYFFLIAWDQMLVTWGNQACLGHSLDYCLHLIPN